ncbi:MAG: hypothetical protein HOP28_17110, partial [Gemmatimonadales bacterium]|nr:hypothetical protein [Gemmatimonadales bacterium]
MRPLIRRFLLAALWLSATVTGLAAQGDETQFKYRHIPLILYLVGEPGWDKLPQGADGKRRLQVYADKGNAQDAAKGAPVYRVHRHTLMGTPEGTAWLEANEAERADRTKKQKEVMEFAFSNPATFDEVIRKNAKTGSALGPPNPRWAVSSDQIATKPMHPDYLPGATHDDYGRGTFYVPTEGPSAEYIENFRVHFVERDGKMLLMSRDPNNPSQLRPIDTQGLFGQSAVKEDRGTCIWVMDANGEFFVLAPEWIKGIADVYGLSGINHSSIPAGHRVAGAGHMIIENGVLKLIDNRSGHYQPSNAMTRQAVKRLHAMGVAMGKYQVSWGNGAKDNPGRTYMALDKQAEEKVRTGQLDAPADEDVTKAPKTAAAEPNQPRVDDAALLEPEEPTQRAQLDVERRAALTRAEPKAAEAPKAEPPPASSVVDAVEAKLKSRTAAQMDVPFMIELYKLDPKAAKVVGTLMAKGEFAAVNTRLGELRKQMDLMVWKDLLKNGKVNVEITNQGKSNGIRSDLDYTLYYLAEASGLTIEQMITEHTKAWQRIHQGMTPEQVEIKVMNGDEFYPDWRNETLTEFEHNSRVKEMLGRLRMDKEKYSVPGANKEQVHNRALREGWTELLAYNPELDKPEIPIERQVIKDAGRTREIAERYRGVQAQYNHMNALGNLVQNIGEYSHHTGDNAQDAIRRAKYANRIINEGLGNLKFFANSYKQIHDSDPNKVWSTKDGRPATRDEVLKEYLKLTFGALVDDNGKPLLDNAQIEKFKRIIDISMQIELDKTGNRNGVKREFTSLDVQREYFRDFRVEAEATVTRELENQQVAAELRERLVVAEQQYLFELQQRQVLAEAVLAGLRHTVARDLTPEGVLRNRVRFDPATEKFVMDGTDGARKVAFERAVEVALFYELVNGIKDPVVRHDLKKRALSTAPTIEIAEFYGALDQVTRAEIDRFIKGEANNKVGRTIDDLIKKSQQRALELAIEKKEKAVAGVKSKGVPVEPTTIAPEAVKDHVMDARYWGLSPERRLQLYLGTQALGNRIRGDFREAFVQNASPLMLGSAAVNLARAYAYGCKDGVMSPACSNVMMRAAISEAIWFMPSYISTPYLASDILLKVKEGKYAEAAWTGTLWGAMSYFPKLGHGMLVYNIATGVPEVLHTIVVAKIDKDLTEQALKARPRGPDGGPIPDGALGPARSRANRFPDAKSSVYRGSPPGFPLFYGRFKNEHAIAPSEVIDGEKYSNGAVPEDNLSDGALADSAGVYFAPLLDSILTAEKLEPGTDAHTKRAWDLKLKYGFDIPFYKRIAKVYDEKYKYVKYISNWPGRYNPDYLSECRLDVYDWYARQPPGYKDELRGEASGLGLILRFLSDQTDKMQEMIAEECALILGRHHEVMEAQAEIDEANKKAFNDIMRKAFDAERSLLAAKDGLRVRIQADEEKAAAAVEKKALELADRHKTSFTIKYPFTYASEELPPYLEFDTRTIPSKVKEPLRIAVEEEMLGVKDGAPAGWTPGKAWADRFTADSTGWVAYRAVTADMRYTAQLLDRDSAVVATAKLDLPVVLYEPTVSGSVSVSVFGMGEKGDSFYYSGAGVTLDKETKFTGSGVFHSVGWSRLKPGTYSFTVAPAKGDERHGPGTGTATVEDPLLSKSPKAKDYASVVVKLPYIPEKKVADKPEDKKPV